MMSTNKTTSAPARVLIIVLLIPCAKAVLCAQTVDEVVKVNVALVTVNVSVTDSKGRVLSGLTASDFQVTDEGKPMQVEFFEDHSVKSVVFVVDLSSSMSGDKWRKLKEGIKSFVSSTNSGNDYTLIGFSDEARVIARSLNGEQLWQVMSKITPAGNTALYDALLLGFEVLDQITWGHKALILFSDGEDNHSKADLAAVKSEALTRQATFYTVGILTDYELSDGDRGRYLLQQLAAATGGLAHFPTSSEIGRVLKAIKIDLRANIA